MGDVVNYRFYLFSRDGHILEAHVAECDGEGHIRETALSLLVKCKPAVFVEVWDRATLVYRTERPNAQPNLLERLG